MTRHTKGAHALTFHDQKFNIISRDGTTWLRVQQIAVALGYKRTDIANQLYQKHAAEFTDSMTAVVKLKTKGGEQEVRIFSLRGAHLLGMFARTEKAVEFRRWVLDILDHEIEAQAERRAKPGALKLAHQPVPQARATHYHYPRKMLDQPYFISKQTGQTILNVAVLTSGTYVSPLMALLNQLRSEGHEVTAPFDEALALRKALIKSGKALDDIQMQALKVRFESAE